MLSVVHPAEVPVDGDDFVGRVAVPFAVHQVDRVGGSPVTGVDQHGAAEIVTDVVGNHAVELEHGLGPEPQLVLQARPLAGFLAAPVGGHAPYEVKVEHACRDVVPL